MTKEVSNDDFTLRLQTDSEKVEDAVQHSATPIVNRSAKKRRDMGRIVAVASQATMSLRRFGGAQKTRRSRCARSESAGVAKLLVPPVLPNPP
jgi:hypothetical protein